MTSTYSSKLPDEPGECVVCGETTYLRCNDCLKGKVDYMFFCGIEHKKLVYPFHRLVCSKEPSPFTWPRLTPDEARSCGLVDGPVGAPGADFLKALYNPFSPSELEAQIDAVKARPKGQRGPYKAGHRFLVVLRFEFFERTLNEESVPLSDRPLLYFVNRAIHYQETKFPGFAANSTHRDADWFKEFQHKVFIRLALDYRLHQIQIREDEDSRKERETLVHYRRNSSVQMYNVLLRIFQILPKLAGRLATMHEYFLSDGHRRAEWV